MNVEGLVYPLVLSRLAHDLTPLDHLILHLDLDLGVLLWADLLLAEAEWDRLAAIRIMMKPLPLATMTTCLCK